MQANRWKRAGTLALVGLLVVFAMRSPAVARPARRRTDPHQSPSSARPPGSFRVVRACLDEPTVCWERAAILKGWSETLLPPEDLPQRLLPPERSDTDHRDRVATTPPHPRC